MWLSSFPLGHGHSHGGHGHSHGHNDQTHHHGHSHENQQLMHGKVSSSLLGKYINVHNFRLIVQYYIV